MKIEMPWIGRNIRYLRRQNGWTLAMLAEKIGICEGPLGRIERGIHKPSAMVIYRLAQTFNVKIDTLFAEETHEIGSVMHSPAARGCFLVLVYQETRTLPSGVIKMAHQLIEVFQALEDICNVQKRAKVPLHVPFEYNKPGIRTLSNAVRRFMGIGDGVVFDYFELFETFGFRVISAPMLRDCDGFSYFDPPNQNVFFFVNSNQNPERQLFRLALELGKVMILSRSIMYRGTDIPDENSVISDAISVFTPENAAKYFAANFLMPEKAVMDTVSQLGIRDKRWSYNLLLRIKHRFGVSAQAFLRRLAELDLIEATGFNEFEQKIQEHYQQTNIEEPGSSKRQLSPNGRFWDLVYSGQDIDEAQEEVLEIEQVLAGWEIPGG